MDNNTLYILAVRVDDGEYIAGCEMYGKLAPVHYTSLEEAKSLFDITYKVLTAGPRQNQASFASQFERMAIFRPAFIKMPRTQSSIDIIKAAGVNDGTITFNEISLLMQPLVYYKVKNGFIEKYLALDILKDIENTMAIGPDGNIIVNQFNIRTPFYNNVKEEGKSLDPDEVLRKRGLI
jgi:hypothetical protein